MTTQDHRATKLLINEYPLQVLPSLATMVGLNEAIFLQQLHYWMRHKTQGKIVDNRKWIRNTVEEWIKDNFPFWDIGVIKRVTKNLGLDGLVDSRSDLNKLPIDRTKWYSINYAALDRLSQGGEPVERIASKKRKRQKAVETRSDITTRREQNVPIGKEQSVPSNGTKCTAAMEQIVPSITRDYTETTSEIKEEKEAPPAHSQNPQPPAPEPAPTDPLDQELVIFKLYRESITPMPCSIEVDHIVSDIVDLSMAGYNALDVFTYAITQAVGANARKLNYIQAIVKNIRDSKMPLAAYIEKRQAKTKRNGGSNGNANQRQTSIPGLRREDSTVEKRANIATGETYYVSRATGKRVPAPA
jgi:hypothetical protein